MMGSYGIGPARIAAAAVEQFADEHGIAWPRALAPFAVELVGLGKPDSGERAEAERIYAELVEAGVEVLFDDRDAGPGEKFADAELLGCPLRLTVGRKTLEAGEIEAQGRRGRTALPGVPLHGAPAAVAERLETLPDARRRAGAEEPPPVPDEERPGLHHARGSGWTPRRSGRRPRASGPRNASRPCAWRPAAVSARGSPRGGCSAWTARARRRRRRWQGSRCTSGRSRTRSASSASR